LFLSAARGDLADDPRSASVSGVLDCLEGVMRTVDGWRNAVRDADAGATAFLELCGLAVGGWIALRLVRLAGQDDVGRRLAAAASFYLAELPALAAAEARLATLGAARLDGFAAYLGS
jgi:hypothetical protein